MHALTPQLSLTQPCSQHFNISVELGIEKLGIGRWG